MLQKLNKKLFRNQKGFSLIELMVAVAILALAAFGIFQAFGTGFRSMAESKDRTVAVNYAQKVLEDIVNKPFEKINPESKEQIEGTKYFKSVIVNNIDTNLKEVNVQISWDSDKKYVDVRTKVYYLPTVSDVSEAISLVVYSDPYYNIVPNDPNDPELPQGVARITALVKDRNNNTINDWEGIIQFSIEDGNYLGNFSGTNPVPTSNGKAEIDFVAGQDEGEVIIKASAEGLNDDTLKLFISYGEVEIDLQADPTDIPSDGNSTSTLTAKVLDAAGEIVDITEKELTFTIEGDITFLDGSKTKTLTTNDDNYNEGVATITVKSSNNPGISKVFVNSDGLIGDTIEIVIYGGPEKISISSGTTTIYRNESARIDISILDSFGNKIDYSGTVNLEISPNDNGFIYDETEDNIINSIVFNSEKTKTIFYSPSYFSEEPVLITASDPENILQNDSMEFNVLNEAIAIKMYADPSNTILADGQSSTKIIAEIIDSNGKTVTDANDLIYFSIIEGDDIGELRGENPAIAINGKAEILFYSTEMPGTSRIEASSGNISNDGLLLIYTVYPKFIDITPDKDIINLGETINVCINIINNQGIGEDYYGNVYLSLNPEGYGNFSDNELNFYDESEKCTNFTALSNNTGKFTINASGEGINSKSIELEIKEEQDIEIKYNDTYSSNKEDVSFEFNVSGGSVNIGKMKITWKSTNSELSQIRMPTSENNDIVYNGPADSGSLIDIIDTNLSEGNFTVYLYFTKNMTNEEYEFIFISDDGSEFDPININT